MTTPHLTRDDQALHIWHGDQLLTSYVYQPPEPQRESPRPYFHPLHTLGGDLVSLYRPHDHVWHKGIAFSLPNVKGPHGTENFWGGTTYLRGQGYDQLPNNGAMVHRDFDEITTAAGRVTVSQRLRWITEAGDSWFDEQRGFSVSVADTHWRLTFTTQLRNIADVPLVFGSPTTEGRDNAGYGGLLWRGPRSFTGGTAYAPGRAGGDELMGVRAPWLGFAGQHDGHGRWSTLVVVDDPDNPGHPTQWFVRSEMFACLCPAPFFATELPVAPGETLSLRYAVVVADGDPGLDGATALAEAGAAALAGRE